MQSLWSYIRERTQFHFYLVTPDCSMVLLHIYAACAALSSAALAFLLLCAIL